MTLSDWILGALFALMLVAWILDKVTQDQRRR